MLASQSDVNVRFAPYNARGDGIADDYPAIQRTVDAVLAAGRGIVHFPDGRYALRSPSRHGDGEPHGTAAFARCTRDRSRGQPGYPAIVLEQDVTGTPPICANPRAVWVSDSGGIVNGERLKIGRGSERETVEVRAVSCRQINDAIPEEPPCG